MSVLHNGCSSQEEYHYHMLKERVRLSLGRPQVRDHDARQQREEFEGCHYAHDGYVKGNALVEGCPTEDGIADNEEVDFFGPDA
ncbi:hypothetical protein ACLOJK_004659 [Asimina triloba]